MELKRSETNNNSSYTYVAKTIDFDWNFGMFGDRRKQSEYNFVV